MIASNLELDGLLIKNTDALNFSIMALEPCQNILAVLPSNPFDEQIDVIRYSLIDADIQTAYVSKFISPYSAEDKGLFLYLNGCLINLMLNFKSLLFETQITEFEKKRLNDCYTNRNPTTDDKPASHAQIFSDFDIVHFILDQSTLSLRDYNDFANIHH